MVNRMSLDLGTARTNEPVIMNRWKYLFVGDCTGVVSIRLGSRSASVLIPDEFDKLTDVREFNFLYVTNVAQSGKTLNIYFEEDVSEEENVDIDRT